MYMIRYSKMVVGSRNQSSVIELSNYNDCQYMELTTYQLGDLMLKYSDSWIIDGEPFNQISAIYDLLKYLRAHSKNIFIHIKSANYDYWTLRGISKTDEILDMCNVLTDRSGKEIKLGG